jgi:hypothetical protein
VTFDYPSVFERSRSMFATAADHSSVSLKAEQLDNLAHTIAFAQRALPGLTTKLPNLPRLGPRPFSAEGAYNLAIRFRQILGNVPLSLCSISQKYSANDSTS